MMQVELPWPPRALSPNCRAHWAAKAAAAKKHKADCQYICMGAGLRALGWTGMVVSLTFHPPSARRSDTDNMMAAMKSGLDGVAAATGVDDSLWSYRLARGEPHKGGKVVLQIERAA